jgi:NADH:ubiquinone oxidoreductase subunit 6 (subunit J)
MSKTSKGSGTAGSVFALIGVYALIYIVCTALFIALFHTSFLESMDVLMYRGAAFIIITGIVSAVIMGIIRKFWGFVTIRDIIMMFVIFCCVNMVFLTLIPVTVERSVSVFMLSYMDENSDQTFTEESVGEVFTTKYVEDYGAFEKRFHEQVETGTIVENPDGTYSITDSGRFVVKMFRTIAEWFGTDQRLVYPNEN